MSEVQILLDKPVLWDWIGYKPIY